MIVGYAYTAMLVTGILHCVLGFCSFITAICGMVGVDIAGYVIRVYNGVALVTAIWVSQKLFSSSNKFLNTEQE